jgi:AbrB family looped-hinge helix DNA binding protein
MMAITDNEFRKIGNYQSRERNFTMATAARAAMKSEQAAKQRLIVTRITNKFQITVPQEVRELFDLREGDLFEWSFDAAESRLTVVPKRAQLLTPQIREMIDRERRAAQNVSA